MGNGFNHDLIIPCKERGYYLTLRLDPVTGFYSYFINDSNMMFGMEKTSLKSLSHEIAKKTEGLRYQSLFYGDEV